MNETVKPIHHYIVMWGNMQRCSMNYTIEDAIETIESLLDHVFIGDICVAIDDKIMQPKITLCDV